MSTHRVPEPLHPLIYADIVRHALAEDIGSGDVTTDSIVDSDEVANAIIVAKEEGVIAGLDIAGFVFDSVGRMEIWKPIAFDGYEVRHGDVVVEMQGITRAILTGERVALNFLQRLSGIATATRKIVRMVEGTSARIVDTRKTTPGLRVLEKYAVRCGGGGNHRLGLYDAVLIKDNHIAAAKDIKTAIDRARLRAGFIMKIEIEARTLDEVEIAIASSPDIVMLDNMSVEQMKEAVCIIDGRCLVEASGNISEDNVQSVAQTGVDMISIGSITHSAPALDLSLNIITG